MVWSEITNPPIRDLSAWRLCFQIKIVVLDLKRIDDPHVSDGLKAISNESMDFNDPKEFDDPQVLDDLKEISIGSMDFDNQKVCGDISIFEGLVFQTVFPVIIFPV